MIYSDRLDIDIEVEDTVIYLHPDGRVLVTSVLCINDEFEFPITIENRGENLDVRSDDIIVLCNGNGFNLADVIQAKDLGCYGDFV